MMGAVMPPFIELKRHAEVIWVASATIATIGPHHPAGSVLMLLNHSVLVVDESPAEVLALLESGWRAH
jgi:hypothetical protein